MSTVTLNEPTQLDWDKYEAGKKFTPPPPAIGADDKPIIYYGTVPTLTPEQFTADKDGNRVWVLDPIKIVKSTNGVDGYALRFTRVSTKPFMGKDANGNPKPKNASSVGNLFRSVGLQSKPQKNAEYDAAVRQAAGRIARFTIEWEARNKDTAEEIRGYANFPDDPERPGQKKAILRAGDSYVDKDGAVQQVKSEVLFANARVRYFQDNK